MKKHYFLSIICLVLSMFSGTAKADGLADILGKYQFTATMTVAEGQDASLLSDNCEVVISSSNGYVYMDGLAGSTQGGHLISDVTTDAQTGVSTAIIKNWNDSNTGNFAGPLYFSNMEAVNVWNLTEPMGDFVMTIDAEGNMTLPDFTIITVTDWNAEKGTVVATFTNAKLTVTEKESTDIPNISGNWTYTHGNGNWDCDKESTFSPDFTFSITATDASNANYTGVFDMGNGFAPITLEGGTFDGMQLKFAYDFTEDKMLLGEQDGAKFYLGNPNGRLKAYGFKFGVVKSGIMTLDGVVSLLKVTPTPSEENPALCDTTTVQWYVNGRAECPELQQKVTVDFTGTYTVTAQYMDAQDGWAIKDDTFTFKVEKDAYGLIVTAWDEYDNIPYGGLTAQVDAADPSRLLITPGYIAFTSTDEEIEAGTYKYIALTDMNGTYGDIALTVAEDGTYALDAFATGNTVWGDSKVDFIRYYSTIISISKEGGDVPGPEPQEEVDFTGTFVVKGGYIDYNDGFATKDDELTFTVEKDEYGYYIPTFGTYENIPYGGLAATVDPDDPNTLCFMGDINYDYETETYTKINYYGGNVTLTKTETGWALSDFGYINYKQGGEDEYQRYYMNVTVTKKTADVDPEPTEGYDYEQYGETLTAANTQVDIAGYWEFSWSDGTYISINAATQVEGTYANIADFYAVTIAGNKVEAVDFEVKAITGLDEQTYYEIVGNVTMGGEKKTIYFTTCPKDQHPDGIQAVKTAGSAVIYDLAGRKVTTAKGLRIVNGKKVLFQ